MQPARLRIRIEITPETPQDTKQGSNLEMVETEITKLLTADETRSLDAMDLILVNNAHSAIRDTLTAHFSKVSKRGHSTRDAPQR